LLIVAATLLGSVPALAQPTPEELQREIEKRDAIINDLAKRLSALEKQVHTAGVSVQPRNQTASIPPPAAAGVTAPIVPGVRLSQAAPPPAAPAGGRVSTAQAGGTPPAPGEDDETLARALENTLVDQGAQVLGAWQVQFVPDFNYAYQSLNQLAYVNLGNGTIGPVTQRMHRDLGEAGFSFRLGLPWESQVNVRVPFDWTGGQSTFAGTETAHSGASGIGDVSVNVIKQVLHEHDYLPDLLFNVAYSADTGSSSRSKTQISTFPFAVGTGYGFDTLSAGVTLLKRQDPLVFLGAFTYTHSFPNHYQGVNEQPGDSAEIRIGPILATSPDTSVRVLFDTVFQGRERDNGLGVAGSEQVISLLEFGAGIVISPHVFLDASVGIGLTPDSPNFRATLSLPIRF
jgi:hypothetical protein